MKNLLIYLLQLFLLLGFTNQNIHSQKREFQIEFSTEKSVFVEQEEIILNIKVINKSKKMDSIWICGGAYNILTGLNVTDDKGKKYKYVGPLIDCIDYYAKLYPGRFLEWDEPILYCYGDMKADFNKFHGYFQEGNYTISFNGKPGQDNPVMRSNEIKFEIKKPGDEDGFERLKEIYSMMDGADKSNNLIKYVYDFPKSGYLDVAFLKCLSLRKYNQNKFDEMYKVIEMFLSLKNNAWNITTCLGICIKFIKESKGENEMIEFLVKVIKQYPKTKVEEEASKFLENTIPNEQYIKMLLN